MNIIWDRVLFKNSFNSSHALFLDNFKNTWFLIYFMKVNFNLKKEYVYPIIGLLVLATGFFVVNALTPGVAPNPGHLITEVAPPSGCGSGQILGWSGGSWGCVDLPVDTDTDTWRPAQTLSVSGQTLSISSGNSVTLPSGGGCLDGYFLFELGNSYVCLKEGAQITSVCCGGSSCGDGYDAHTWARNNGGTMQTRTEMYTHGSLRCSTGWVNGNSQCSYWELTAYATVTSGGLQSKLMQGATTHCIGNIPW